MQRVEAIIRPERLDTVKEALAEAGFVGLNTTAVTGRGRQRGVVLAHEGRTSERQAVDMLPKVKVDLVVPDDAVERVIEVILVHARTGRVGDGKVFVSPVLRAIRVRTGEEGDAAL